MKLSCVISEFNPFHNGHKYLIEKEREHGATHIAAVMSGSFVQRGECAVLNKFDRARCALMNGVDLVIELPVVWACSAAPVFARAGISIIKSLGVADSIFFGSECGDVKLIERCANALLSDEFEAVFSKYKSDKPYAEAVQSAVLEISGKECAGVLSSPNNILAVEYVKEMIAQGGGLQAHTIRRRGVEHDSGEAAEGFASASYIRSKIDSPYEFNGLVPNNTLDILNSAHSCGDIADFTALNNIILYRLRTMSQNELSNLPDVSGGLENRINHAVLSSAGVDEVLSAVRCKRYSVPRIKRAFTAAALGINKEMQSGFPPYIRVLGINQRGGEILKKIKKTCGIPVITKAAQYKKLLDKAGTVIFEKDILASDLRTLACKGKISMGQDFLISPCVL